jgi:[ribosomal protein S5]-alanine N-acetyltransferase
MAAGDAHVDDGSGTPIRLRPVAESDLPIFHRIATEPDVSGPDWTGFRDPQAAARRFANDGFLDAEGGRLVVEVGVTETGAAPAGVVTWRSAGHTAGKYWVMGILLLPEYRRRGIGWRAQALLADYLFAHTPVQRIEAGTQAFNVAEQRALEKAGFQREGVLRSAEFRAGDWGDVWIYGRIRSDPSPLT